MNVSVAAILIFEAKRQRVLRSKTKVTLIFHLDNGKIHKKNKNLN
jgi:hypothetical protein